jgi:hypothetical protein
MNPEIPKWKLDQLNILDFGNTIQVVGVVYADAEVAFVCMMPDEPMDDKVVRVLELDQEEWKGIIKQTDLVETEVFANAPDGDLAKIIVRKSTRVIEQGISWSVFRRDQYHCRYCGANDVPLTVDHLVTWEDGGPSIEENLVTSCRKCNKARGNKPYEVWLKSNYYKKVSVRLSNMAKEANERIVEDGVLDTIPLRTHSRGRNGR